MNGFLGIGSGELVIILVIAVLVVGPEKMVELATKIGLMVAKIRRMTNEATKEFREALAVEEVQQAFREVADEVKDIGQEIKGTAKDVASIETEAVAATQDFKTVAEGATIAPVVAPKPAGTIPQAVLDRLGPPPVKAAATVGSDVHDQVYESSAEDDPNAPPTEIPHTSVIENEKDLEPIQIEEIQVYEAESESQPSDEENPA